jgi:hypothetical protein
MYCKEDFSAFRAQLVVAEHRQMFDYWLECCAGRKMPSRADINPMRMAKLLPGVSLITVAENLFNSTVRLAGTRLREVHDREITGLKLEQLDLADRHDYWMAAYRRAAEQGLPAQGVLKAPRRHKEHLVQYWLRLPLGQGEGRADMILGHDHFSAATPHTSTFRQIA